MFQRLREGGVKKAADRRGAQGRVCPCTRKTVLQLASEVQSRGHGFPMDSRMIKHLAKTEISQNQDLPGNRGKLLGFEFTEKYRARGIPEVESLDDFRDPSCLRKP